MVPIIKQLRNENNITQKQLAEMVGVTQSYISKIENNGYEEYDQVIDICDKLAQALSICPFFMAIWAMNKKLNYPLSYFLIKEFERVSICNKCSYKDCNARKGHKTHFEISSELGVFNYEQN